MLNKCKIHDKIIEYNEPSNKKEKQAQDISEQFRKV